MREKGFSLPLLLVVVAVLGMVLLGVAYFQLRQQSTQQSRQTQITTQPTPSPTEIDETANWKTYTNNQSI